MPFLSLCFYYNPSHSTQSTKMTLPTTKLGSQGFQVSAQGLGCMEMSALYGPPKPEDEMFTLIRHAVSKGITFLDTSDFYGPFTNEILVGKAVKGIRENVQLDTKFGVKSVDGKRQIQGHPAYVRAACEGSLKRLDVDYIDLYYQHRVDKAVPIEITTGELKKLVEERKIKYIGLSEAPAETIRRAHAVHPITAVQVEWSLWCRDVKEEIVPTCIKLGIGIVSYSPLGRGFLSSGPKLMETLADNGYTKYFPRFQADNIEKKKIACERICEMASEKGCTPSQVALAWVQHQGNDVVPIPGTTKLKNLEDNIGAFSVKLTPQEIQEKENAVSSAGIAVERYPEGHMSATWKNVNTPTLSS